jgi:uncharacterized protein YndB with AHSA1/START domain
VEATGTLEQTGSTVTVRFDRAVSSTPEQLWAALTQPSWLVKWLAEAEFDASVGGRVHLVWPGEGEMHGVVLACEPHRAIEYSWTEAAASVLRLEVEPTASECAFLLLHTGTTRDDAPGFGAGWQSHLEALDVVLGGGTSTPAERDARYTALRPAYDELLAAL